MSNSDQRPEADTDNSVPLDPEDGRPGLSRRELIKLGAASAVAASLSVGETVSAKTFGLAGTHGATQTAKSPLFFTPDELAMVDEISELIIPTDDHSPGARPAKVAEYIDFRLSEAWEDKDKTSWRDGLKLVDQISQEMNSKPFMQSTAEQRSAVLTRMAQNEAKPQKPEEVFFKELKGFIVYTYYTSEIGIKKEMEYKGNTYLKEFVGYDAT
jgi:hypothetical protein